MKKVKLLIVILLLAAVMLIVASCVNKGKETRPQETAAPVVTEIPTQAPAEAPTQAHTEASTEAPVEPEPFEVDEDILMPEGTLIE